MAWLGRLLVVLLAAIAFCFAALAVNQNEVALRFLAWETPAVSLFWWLLLTFGMGLIIGLLGMGFVSLRARFRQRSLSRRLDASEQELRKLRNLSLHD